MIIIIHPGSLNLRIGRASDLNPHRVLHAVARRRRPGGKVHRDYILPPCVEKVLLINRARLKFAKMNRFISFMQTKELLQEFEECRLQVSHTLQSCLQSNGRRRYATPPQQISAFNRRAIPEIVEEKPNAPQEPEREVLFGDEVSSFLKKKLTNGLR